MLCGVLIPIPKGGVILSLPLPLMNRLKACRESKQENICCESFPFSWLFWRHDEK